MCFRKWKFYDFQCFVEVKLTLVDQVVRNYGGVKRILFFCLSQVLLKVAHFSQCKRFLERKLQKVVKKQLEFQKFRGAFFEGIHGYIIFKRGGSSEKLLYHERRIIKCFYWSFKLYDSVLRKRFLCFEELNVMSIGGGQLKMPKNRMKQKTWFYFRRKGSFYFVILKTFLANNFPKTFSFNSFPKHKIKIVNSHSYVLYMCLNSFLFDSNHPISSSHFLKL